jgi:hypothetical protein
MIRPWSNLMRRPAPGAFRLAMFAALVVGCSNEPSSPVISGSLAPRESNATASGITVTSASPDSATRGTTLDVTIAGSGFASDAAASWALSGVTDPSQVRTNSTHYVNQNKLVANITISSTATIGSWDVIITSGKKTGIGSDAFSIKLPNPSATWKLPLNDAGLSLKSDRQYSDGTYSVYANGVCNMVGGIAAGLSGGSGSNTGNAIMQMTTASHGKCGRLFTIAYPDGVTETLMSNNNLTELETSTYSIPIGSTATRRLIVDPGILAPHPTRCGRLVFGVGAINQIGIGTDSVLVTRIDASTWQVHSQAPPRDKALCYSTGALFEMPVSFLVVSSFPLP